MQWHVRPALPAAKLITAVAVPALAVLFAQGDPVRWGLAFVVATALTAWAARDLFVPVRLAADPEGITVVTGFARRRHLPWSNIERVRVEGTARRGLRNQLLEIDAGDALYLFSKNELSALPEDVAVALADLRTVS